MKKSNWLYALLLNISKGNRLETLTYVFFFPFVRSHPAIDIGNWDRYLTQQPEAANLALAVVLLLVIVIQAVFNAWQDHVTSQVMASISNLVGAEALVLRDGTIITVAASELVPGDVVKVRLCFLFVYYPNILVNSGLTLLLLLFLWLFTQITLGCKLPADLRLIEISSDLKFDRSILTGESDAIPATIDSTDCNFLETRNVALQGTWLTSKLFISFYFPGDSGKIQLWKLLTTRFFVLLKKLITFFFISRSGTLCTSGSGIGIVVQTGDNTVFGRIAKLSSQGTGRRTTLEAEILRFVM